MRETDYAGAKAEIATGETPLIVDLHAPWCKYCVATRPHLERIEEERGDAIRMIAVDTDEDPDAFTGFGVKTIPAIILFKDGAEIARHESGDYDKLTAWLAEHGI